MPTLNGHYRIDAPGAHFFAANILHLRVRDHRVIGRFGRRGYLRGRLLDSTVDARWRCGEDVGWMTIHFVSDYTSAECAYGRDDDKEVGRMPLHKMTRAPKARLHE